MEVKMKSLVDDIKKAYATTEEDMVSVRTAASKKRKRIAEEDLVKKHLVFAVNYVRALGEKGESVLEYPDNEDDFPESFRAAVDFFIAEGLKLQDLMHRSAKIEDHNATFMEKIRRDKSSVRDVRVKPMKSRGKDPSYDCAIRCGPVRANSIRQIFVTFNSDGKSIVKQHQVHEAWAKTFVMWFRIASLQYMILMAAKEGTSLGTEILFNGLKTAYTHMADKFCLTRGNLNEWWFKSLFF